MKAREAAQNAGAENRILLATARVLQEECQGCKVPAQPAQVYAVLSGSHVFLYLQEHSPASLIDPKMAVTLVRQDPLSRTLCRARFQERFILHLAGRPRIRGAINTLLSLTLACAVSKQVHKSVDSQQTALCPVWCVLWLRSSSPSSARAQEAQKLAESGIEGLQYDLKALGARVTGLQARKLWETRHQDAH